MLQKVNIDNASRAAGGRIATVVCIVIACCAFMVIILAVLLIMVHTMMLIMSLRVSKDCLMLRVIHACHSMGNRYRLSRHNDDQHQLEYDLSC